MIISTIKRTCGIALFAMVSVGSFAQDLIARQAPSDRRMKDVRNVKLNNTAAAVDLSNPASEIYTDWTGDIRKCSGHVPSNYKIDLRGFAMPTPSRKINSPFGPRWGRQHEGLDIKVYIGDTIRAAFDGKVRICKYNGSGYGYYIVIRHPNGLETLYGHLSKQIVKTDQIVRAGEPIGLGGNTGRSKGSHLHFETRLLGRPINPALLFDFESQDVTGDFYVVRTGTVSKSATASAARTANHIDAENEKREANLAAAPATHGTSEPAPANTAPSKQVATVKAQAQKKSSSHSVKKGDTLYSIAHKYGTTVDKLCKLNNIKSTATLQLGQVLKYS